MVRRESGAGHLHVGVLRVVTAAASAVVFAAGMSACAALLAACGGAVDETPPVTNGTNAAGGGGAAASGPCGAGPTPTMFAEGIDGPNYLALDGDSLYVAASRLTGAGLLRYPTAEGPPQSLAPAPGAYGIVVDSTHVYWVEYENHGALKRVPHHGGLVETLATTPRGTDLAVDATTIYWLGTGTIPAGYSDGVVMKLAKSGGAPVTVASEQASVAELRVARDHVYWRRATNVGGQYKTELVRVSKSGGPEAVVAAAATILGVATDDEHVYWSVSTLGAVPPSVVFRAVHGSSNAEQLAKSTLKPFELHVSGPCLYALDTEQGGFIERVDKEGGRPAPFATFSSVSAIASDESFLYATQYDTGKIWAVAK